MLLFSLSSFHIALTIEIDKKYGKGGYGYANALMKKEQRNV